MQQSIQNIVQVNIQCLRYGQHMKIQKTKSSILVILLSIFMSFSIFAFSEIGLAPTIEGLTRMEVSTAYCHPKEAIFYNPAILADRAINIQLVSAGLQVDKNSADSINKLAKSDSISTLDLLSETVQREDLLLARARLNILNIALPYFGYSMFLSGRFNSQKINNVTDPYLDTRFRLRFGEAVGFAFNINQFAFGFSIYSLEQSSVRITPNDTQITTIQDAIAANDLSPSTTSFSDFTSMKLGGGTGYNFGALFRPFAGNGTGLGFAILNVGGTKFTPTGWSKIIDIKDYNFADEVKEEADRFGILLGTPNEIHQMINAGLHLSNDRESLLNATYSLDYQDIGGATIKHKLAMAGELGFKLSDKVALITSLPVFTKNNHTYYT